MDLRTLRKTAGLTQAQLAADSGVNARQIQRIENGESRIENVTLGNAARLAAALGIPVEDLLRE